MKYKKFICIVLLLVFSISIKAQIFQDNLTGETAGQFPSKWELIKGSATVASINDSTVISFTNKSIITPKTGSTNYLPESFTLEFDAFFDAANKIHYNHDYQVRFWEGESYITFEGNNDFYYPIRIYRHGARIVGRLDGSSIKYEKLNRSMNVAENLWRHITIDFNKGTLKVSVDNFIAIDISNYRFNPRMISIEAFFNAVGSKGAIKNISIKGTPVVISNPPEDGTDSTQTSGDGTNSTEKKTLKINDLLDGKSDSSGYSVYLGLNAGVAAVGKGPVTSNQENVGIGYEALKNTTIGTSITAIGFKAMYSNTMGFLNTANGYEAMYYNTIGRDNTAIGSRALYKNTTGENNTANGSYALYRNETGNDNTANGYKALYNTIGRDNTAIGSNALYNNTTGYGNTASGYRALTNNTTGMLNTANGVEALSRNTTGESNAANGFQALFKNTEGNNNTANGYQALYQNANGFGNTANGYHALFYNNGEYNTAIGYKALYSNSSGIGNTAIGYDALTFSKGNNNTAIGFNAQVPDGTASNQVRIGDKNIKYAGVQVPWHISSDVNWKEDINLLPYGLDEVMQLKPVDYVRKNNEENSREMGFIAQDVEKMLSQIDYKDQGFLTKDDNGNLNLRYNDFIPLLTKAIQDQQMIIEQQKIKLQEQSNKYDQLLKRIEKLEKQNN